MGGVELDESCEDLVLSHRTLRTFSFCKNEWFCNYGFLDHIT